MDFAASLVELQAEASCPLCLDYLRDPVTTECGHNFCRSCIHQRWEDLQDIFPCPVCLHHCPERNFKRNIQLCHMTDIVKQIPTMRRKMKRQENPLCKKHREVMSLFCEETWSCCVPCRNSSNHGDQSLIPIEEAAASLSGELRNYIESLREPVEDAEKGFEMKVSKGIELQWKMDNRRSALYCEVEQFKCFLEREQDEVHIRLLNKEPCVQEKITENNHSSILKNLLSEVIRKCLQTDLDFLTGIESIHSMYENQETPRSLFI